MGKTKKLALMALLTAIALTIFVIENQIPTPVPVPGVKLGLANIITLIAMKLLGKKEAGAVLLVRILMGAMFAGSPSTLLFSAAGGALAYLVMCLTLRFFGDDQLWIVSAPGSFWPACWWSRPRVCWPTGLSSLLPASSPAFSPALPPSIY